MAPWLTCSCIPAVSGHSLAWSSGWRWGEAVSELVGWGPDFCCLCSFSCWWAAAAVSTASAATRDNAGSRHRELLCILLVHPCHYAFQHGHLSCESKPRGGGATLHKAHTLVSSLAGWHALRPPQLLALQVWPKPQG